MSRLVKTKPDPKFQENYLNIGMFNTYMIILWQKYGLFFSAMQRTEKHMEVKAVLVILGGTCNLSKMTF